MINFFAVISLAYGAVGFGAFVVFGVLVVGRVGLVVFVVGVVVVVVVPIKFFIACRAAIFLSKICVTKPLPKN